MNKETYITYHYIDQTNNRILDFLNCFKILENKKESLNLKKV